MNRTDSSSTRAYHGAPRPLRDGYAALVGIVGFVAVISLGWAVPRIEQQIDQSTPSTAVATDSAAPATQPATPESSLVPAGPTIVAPPGDLDLPGWAWTDVITPVALSGLWGVVIAWALWFRPRSSAQQAGLEASRRRVEDLTTGIDTASSRLRDRDATISKLEADLVAARREAALLEERLSARDDAGTDPPRRRSTD